MMFMQELRFNGAATLSLRKLGHNGHQNRNRQAASMGPQLYRCGNERNRMHMIPMIWQLQWGRNFIVAEIRNGKACSLRMSLLQWGRNFIVAEIMRVYESKTKHYKLQWGRNFIVAEMCCIVAGREYLYLLASMEPQLYRCGNWCPGGCCRR